MMKHVIYKAHGQDVNSVDWNNNNGSTGLLASAGDDGLVKVWTINLPEFDV